MNWSCNRPSLEKRIYNTLGYDYAKKRTHLRGRAINYHAKAALIVIGNEMALGQKLMCDLDFV